jgi:hypothetical protein
MGFRFRKSVSIAPGVRLNLNKKSVGVSVGNKVGGISYNTRTGARARVSAPGTGISYTTKIGGGATNTASATPTAEIQVTQLVAKDKWVSFWLCVLLGYFGVHKFYEGKTKSGLLYLCTFGLFGFGWMFDTLVILCKPNPYFV